MLKKNAFMALALSSVVALGAVVISIIPIQSKANDLFAEIQDGSINFNRTTGVQTQIGKNYYTSGKTANGTELFVYNASELSLESKYVAKMVSNAERGSTTPEIRFLAENSGNSDFYFQSISSITLTSDSANNRTLNVLTSSDGNSFDEYGTLTVNSSGGTIDLNGAHYVRFTYPSGFYTVGITDISINFRCSYDPSDWDTPETSEDTSEEPEKTPLELLTDNNGGAGWSLADNSTYEGTFNFDSNGTGVANIANTNPSSEWTVTQTFDFSALSTNDDVNYSSVFSNISMTSGTESNTRYYLRELSGKTSSLAFTITAGHITSMSITIFSVSFNITRTMSLH